MNLEQPEEADLPHTEWKCEECGAANSCIDGDCQFCEGPEPEPVPPPFYTVAVYLTDRAFGGPQEGGWWYDIGERRDDPDETGCVPAIFRSTEHPQAIACRELTQARLDETVNQGRREISSVLSTGRYVARICEGWPETHYPAVRPHYE